MVTISLLQLLIVALFIATSEVAEGVRKTPAQEQQKEEQQSRLGTIMDGSIFEDDKLKSFISFATDSIYSSIHLPKAKTESPSQFFSNLCSTCGFPTPSTCENDASSESMKKVYFHAVFDFKRPSAFPLLVNQVCRSLSICIGKSRFRIVLHLSVATLHQLSTTIVTSSHINFIPGSLSNNLDSYSVVDFLHSLESGQSYEQQQRPTPSLEQLELQQYHLSCAFLTWYGIPYKTWVGIFDTLTLQQARLRSLSDVTKPSQVIFQVDADEFPILPSNLSVWIKKLTEEEPAFTKEHKQKPNRRKLVVSKFLPETGSNIEVEKSTKSKNKTSGFGNRSGLSSEDDKGKGGSRNAMKKEKGNTGGIQRGRRGKQRKGSIDYANGNALCDVIYGNLVERLPPDGVLVNMSLDSPLANQFPVMCDIKSSIEEAVRRKLILFRGSFRPGIGNHKLLCERPKGKESVASEVHTCQEILNKQPTGLMIYHPPLTRVPRRCSASNLKEVGSTERIYGNGFMRVDHYKYIWGIQQYLEERARVFEEAKIPWYKQSLSVLSHLKKYDGRICIECQGICPKITD